MLSLFATQTTQAKRAFDMRSRNWRTLWSVGSEFASMMCKVAPACYLSMRMERNCLVRDSIHSEVLPKLSGKDAPSELRLW